MEQPKRPNVLVTGTPGTGKTSLSTVLAQELGFRHIEVSKLVKEEQFYTSYDEKADTYDIEEDDEDKLLDHLEPIMVAGGNVIDFHSCDFFPERWFHVVVVLHATTEVLFDRLSARGYSEAKRDENMEAEIMQLIEGEALESYRPEIVHVRDNNTLDEMSATVDLVVSLVNDLKQTNADGQ